MCICARLLLHWLCWWPSGEWKMVSVDSRAGLEGGRADSGRRCLTEAAGLGLSLGPGTVGEQWEWQAGGRRAVRVRSVGQAVFPVQGEFQTATEGTSQRSSRSAETKPAEP